jgi:hypothetical protein
MNDNQVKLPFGLRNGNGELKHISTVQSGLACECYCAACGARLMAKKGEKNAHSFAHYQAEECEHGLETALHLAAKKILEESAQITLPKLTIYEEVSGEMCGQSRTKKGEAIICEQHIAYLKNIEPEKRLNTIIPDIIADIDGVPLIIEIAVTHFVDRVKQNKIHELGIACIEINLKDVFRNADLESIRSIVIESVANKVWLFHAETARIRTELKSTLEAELQSELEQIYQKDQERQRQLYQKAQEYQQRQDNLRHLRLESERENEESIQQSMQPDLDLMNDYLKETDSRHLEFAQALPNLPIWKRASNNMRVSLTTLPDFLNHSVKGEEIFACDRRAWQTGLFSAFIYKKFQKYDEPYPIAINRMIEWCEKYVPFNQFALALWSNKVFLKSLDSNAFQNFNRYTAIQEFTEHLEREGFIEHYYLDKYKIINDTLSIDDDSGDIFLNALSADEQESFQERAAIHEFCGGLDRKEAEKLAYAALY